jgi:hypothetical protein
MKNRKGWSSLKEKRTVTAKGRNEYVEDDRKNVWVFLIVSAALHFSAELLTPSTNKVHVPFFKQI